MGLSQGLAATLGHSDITELSFLYQFVERPGRFLDRNLGVDPSTLEEVQLLGSPEVLANVVNAAPQIFLTANPLSYNSEETDG